MPVVSAIVQEGWREVQARLYALDISQTVAEPTTFKVGEGGFIDVPPKEPDTPDATREDLFSEGTLLAGGGTATFTNASVNVTGVGTSFLADISPGEWIKPGPTFGVLFGMEGANARSAGDVGSEYDDWGEVQSISDDFNLVLSAPYAGASTGANPRGVYKAPDPWFTFRKVFSPGDVVFSSGVPAITEFTAILLAGEANLTQLGVAPEFFELAAFDANNVMMYHMTFPLESKTAVIQLNHIIELIF